MGLTPNNHISKALTIGIQQLVMAMRADRARLNTGAAMSATTAGRMPLNMDATTGLS